MRSKTSATHRKLNLLRRAKSVKLVVFDCDGVLTDGRTWIDHNGQEMIAFNVQDGTGIKWLHRAGIPTAIITGRNLPAVRFRADQLGVSFLLQEIKDKKIGLQRLCELASCNPENICYVGDDLLDLPILSKAALAVAVANAKSEARQAAHYVTAAAGGHGAVREVAELIIKAQGKWADVTARYRE